MPKIGLLFNGVWSQYAFAKAGKYRNIYHLLYIHDLSWDRLRQMDALVIPFQSNQKAIGKRKGLIQRFLGEGKKIFVEGDSSAAWLDAQWEDRPVNNYWWVSNPDKPPVSETDYSHPIYQGLKPRHAFWHYHGVYTNIPQHAKIIQKNRNGEVISWETDIYGGALFVTTLDPIVEHGVQQITHLDHYCDQLTEWLVGQKPKGSFNIFAEDYGIAWPS